MGMPLDDLGDFMSLDLDPVATEQLNQYLATGSLPTGPGPFLPTMMPFLPTGPGQADYGAGLIFDTPATLDAGLPAAISAAASPPCTARCLSSLPALPP